MGMSIFQFFGAAFLLYVVGLVLYRICIRSYLIGRGAVRGYAWARGKLKRGEP